MDSDKPLPKKTLFPKRRLPSKHSQSIGDTLGFDKTEIIICKAKIQFEHDLEISLKSFEKDLHLLRLKNLRHLAETLKDDAWMYPDLEAKLVVSYENSLLRQSDVELLDPPNWLNDNIIAFWFEYLEYDVYKKHKDKFGFVCPQVVQYLKFGLPEEVKSTVEELELDKKQYVFLPVNDCRAQTVPGGTHWSLLVYNAQDQAFEHYDSYPGSYNLSVAENLAKILGSFLRSSSTFGQQPVIREMTCTQQNNTYDCGMHVICNTDGLCRKYIHQDSRPLMEIVPSKVVSNSRDVIKDIIRSLKK